MSKQAVQLGLALFGFLKLVCILADHGPLRAVGDTVTTVANVLRNIPGQFGNQLDTLAKPSLAFQWTV